MVDMEDLENGDTEEFEQEESVTELCRTPPVKQGSKLLRKIVGDLIDRAKREDARKTASIQDAERRPVGSTRYDVNSYGGGVTIIPDVCLIEKRKVR
jgi:hypothetical protein